MCGCQVLCFWCFTHETDDRQRAHHNIERIIVPLLDGSVPPQFCWNYLIASYELILVCTCIPTVSIRSQSVPATTLFFNKFIRCMRAIVEFMYRAQDPIHTHSSLASMTTALQDFHDMKHAILEAGAQRGTKGAKGDFNIPKLELLHSFAHHTKDNGTLIQYTADISEQLLITHCKTPFECTSCQSNNFVDQVVKLLNHKETICCFDLYHLLQGLNVALDNAILIENDKVAAVDPALSFIEHIDPEKENTFHRPWRYHNHFNNPSSFLSQNAALIFHVTVCCDYATLSATQMQTLYQLPDLLLAITNYQLRAEIWPIYGMSVVWSPLGINAASSCTHHFECDTSWRAKSFRCFLLPTPTRLEIVMRCSWGAGMTQRILVWFILWCLHLRDSYWN